MALPATYDSLTSSITSLANAFGYLFSGNFPEFFASLFGGIDVIAVFLFVMFLFKFVLELTLMTEERFKSYATWIGVGFGLFSLAIPTIYNFLSQFLIYLVIGIFIIFIWYTIRIFRTKGAGMFQSAKAKAYQSEAARYEAQGQMKKAEHELDMMVKQDKHEDKVETTFLRQEERSIYEAEDKITEMTKGKRIWYKPWKRTGGSEDAFKAVIALRSLLATPSSSYSKKNKETLDTQLTMLVGFLRLHNTDLQTLRSAINRLEQIEKREWFETRKTKSRIDAEKKNAEVIQKASLTNLFKGKKAKLAKSIPNEIQRVEQLERQIEQLEQHRLNLLQRLKQLEQADEYDNAQLAMLRNQLLQELTSGDHQSARQTLDQLETKLREVINLLHGEESLLKQITQLEHKQRYIEQEVTQLDNLIQLKITKLENETATL